MKSAKPQDEQELVFLSRARRFRLPYDRSPRDLLPEEHREGRLDLAEAIFGRLDAEAGAIKGRVRVEDCVAGGEPSPRGWYEQVIEPHTLSSPKVTTFAHYLTQDGSLEGAAHGLLE